MAATLKLTAATTAELDLSTYLNVQEDSGLDPADGGFLEPAFTDSPIGAGQALINIDAQNKELVYALQLKGATKDALHALVGTIRRKLDEPGVRVEWKDDSATLSTFYDLEFGRLEPAYRYFRARQKWLAASLHLWVRPYGHTATERIVATIAATGHGAPVLLIGSLAGDVGALAQYSLTVASAGEVGFDYDAIVAAVLPSPSYPFRTPAASMPLTGATRSVGSGAAASQFLGTLAAYSGAILTAINMPFPGLMGGRHRVLATVKAGQVGGINLYAASTQQTIGSVTVTASTWTLVDFGVWSVPSQVASRAAAVLDIFQGSTASGTLVGSYRWNINEVYLLPEEQSCLLRAPLQGGALRYMLDGVNSNALQGDTTSLYTYDVTSSLRGQMPTIPPAATVAIGMLRAPIIAATPGDEVPPAQNVTVEIRVRERFSFQR